MSEELAAGAEVASFFCPGRPRTKGSLDPIIVPGAKGGRRGMKVGLTDTPQSKAWKQAMIKVIREKYGIVVRKVAGKPQRVDGGQPYPGAVQVYFRVWVDQERSPNGLVWPSHYTPYPTAMDIGDGDKFERNVLDALTQSGLILDDRLVVDWGGRKRWADAGQPAGIHCTVTAAP